MHSDVNSSSFPANYIDDNSEFVYQQELVYTLPVVFPSRRYEGLHPQTLRVTRRFFMDSKILDGKTLLARASVQGFRSNFIGEDHHLRTIKVQMDATVAVLHRNDDQTLVEVTAEYTSLLRDDNEERRWSTGAEALIFLLTTDDIES